MLVAEPSSGERARSDFIEDVVQVIAVIAHQAPAAPWSGLDRASHPFRLGQKVAEHARIAAVRFSNFLRLNWQPGADYRLARRIVSSELCG